MSFQGRKEGNVLFNDALNTFYLRLYGVRHMVKDHSVRREETCCHMGYSFRITARVLLYASSHRQDNTYHSLCYTSRGALAETRNSSISPPHEGSIRRPIAPWANALTTELHLVPRAGVSLNIHAPITTLLSLSWVHCHPWSNSLGDVLSNLEISRSYTGPDLGNGVGVSIPQIQLSRSP